MKYLQTFFHRLADPERISWFQYQSRYYPKGMEYQAHTKFPKSLF